MTHDWAGVEGGDFVNLAGIEFPGSLLADPSGEAHLAENEPACALRDVLADRNQMPIAQSGWRIISKKEDEVAFAAPARDEGWDVIVVARDSAGSWGFRSGGYVQQPTITRSQRGANLHLEWDESTMSFERGTHPQARLLLVNDRDEEWVDDRGEYWGIARVLDPRTGEPFPGSRVAIAGVGRHYRVPPGEKVSFPVAIATRARQYLPPGEYGIEASIHQLALTAPRGNLRVYESPDLPFRANTDDPYLLFDLVQLAETAVMDAQFPDGPNRRDLLIAFRERLRSSTGQIESPQVDSLVRRLDARIEEETLPGLAPSGEVEEHEKDAMEAPMLQSFNELRLLGVRPGEEVY